MGATRNIALNELNLRGISVNPAEGTTTISVVPSDSGVIFVNKNEAANTEYVLPTTVADGAGKMWWFLNGTGGLKVTAPTNTMVGNNSVTKNYAVTAASTIGYNCMVIGDGEKYYLFQMGSLVFTVS